MLLKPLQTIYDGYRFRSRLEARWAVFFKNAGIPYEYEKQGYDLGDDIYYLPDFWLPMVGYWVEIKGQHPTPGEVIKASRLCLATQKPVYIFVGDPLVSQLVHAWLFVRDNEPLPGGPREPRQHRYENDLWNIDQVSDIYNYMITSNGGDVALDFQTGSIAFDVAKASSLQWNFEQCEGFYYVDLQSNKDWRTGEKIRPHWRILQAQQKARQARFEHGERP